MSATLFRSLAATALLIVSFPNVVASTQPLPRVILTTIQSADPTPSIRRQYTSINQQLRKYRKIKKQLSGFSLEGGELTAYLDGQRIVKIVANHFGEGGQTLEEYYYRNGKLIFVFEKISHYDRPLSGRVVSTSENRYYFSNDRLVRWIDENRREASDVDVIESKRIEYLGNSKVFTNGARSKSRTVEANALTPSN